MVYSCLWHMHCAVRVDEDNIMNQLYVVLASSPPRPRLDPSTLRSERSRGATEGPERSRWGGMGECLQASAPFFLCISQRT